MLGRTYDGEACSVARSLEVVGERWTLLIVRDILLGVHKFEDLHRSLGIARNILQARLELLTEEGVVEKRPYQEGRFHYFLTPKGEELWPVLRALLRWGDRHYAPNGPPRLAKHRGCGGDVSESLACDKCGKPIELEDVDWKWGPGAKKSKSRSSRRRGQSSKGTKHSRRRQAASSRD